MADKSLKLQKYKLDNDKWKVIGDLISVLHVSAPIYSQFNEN